MSPITLAQTLTYLGTLPFIYGGLAHLGLAPFAAWLPFAIDSALLAYAAVILSFLAGIHWGLALGKLDRYDQKPLARRLLWMSNIIALWAWLMWLLPSSVLAFWGMALGFAVMLAVDWRWLTLAQTQAWFWRLRWQASFIAMLSLVVMGF
ncbi:DUF3429 domain-containing protein [Thiomicrospira sp. R3]|uniref:DUF3429 domain-containing protein n=1 Tax=Thiomicrospira sp. R3 TaxID=3035472 RepID=UPI00259B5124|nr:DUF3429 domain-containing protein [Thiomicrospira sp. R3]WFE68935.1 DUF3429 domain-containing protein [Thiomicrospira sp. R3]